MPKTVFTDEYKSMAQMLIALRNRRSLTQEDVGILLGRPQQFVQKYEKGDRRIDVVEFYVIVKALGADPVEIFTNLVADFAPNILI